jgi:hypothetical protein
MRERVIWYCCAGPGVRGWAEDLKSTVVLDSLLRSCDHW